MTEAADLAGTGGEPAASPAASTDTTTETNFFGKNEKNQIIAPSKETEVSFRYSFLSAVFSAVPVVNFALVSV